MCRIGLTWLVAVMLLGAALPLAHAQRGGRGPGGGLTRPTPRPGGNPGGGLNRPTTINRPGPSARPSLPTGGLTRPSTLPGKPTRPSNPGGNLVNRPGGGNPPAGLFPNRPGGGNPPGGNLINRPGGGNTRPSPLPGPIGNRPGGNDGNRPGGGLFPNRPGGGDRPTTLPGPIGNRPDGNRPGGGLFPNRPGGDRPTTLPGIIGNRPGGNDGNGPGGGLFPDRPGGGIVNRPGQGNRPWPRPDRPNIGDIIGSGNNSLTNNNINNITNITNNNNWFGVNNYYQSNYYGGGGGWFGGGGWYGGGGGRWYGACNPYWGYHHSWYQGCWDRNYFGNAFLAGFGSALGTGLGYGLFGGYMPYGGYSYGVYDVFPTWSASTLGTWGLGSVVNNVLYANYTNPYYITLPAATTSNLVYDYSKPIEVAATPPEPSATDTAMQVFDAARDSFKAGDYPRALSLTDQALQQVPNDPAMHEFRALALFALKRYDEAAAVAYAVLTNGPGWNWSTLIGLYPDTDVYTNQLRALEAQVKTSPKDAGAQFLLAYHYLIQGHAESARYQFQKVAELQPNDALAARFIKALTPPEPAVTPPAPVPAQAEAPAQTPPEPPPASLAGVWTAQAGPGTSIALTLAQDGGFTWDVTSDGQTQTLTGQAAYRDNVLTLAQEQGPPLAGKLEITQPDRFTFRLLGNDKAPPLVFTR